MKLKRLERPASLVVKFYISYVRKSLVLFEESLISGWSQLHLFHNLLQIPDRRDLLLVILCTSVKVLTLILWLSLTFSDAWSSLSLCNLSQFIFYAIVFFFQILIQFLVIEVLLYTCRRLSIECLKHMKNVQFLKILSQDLFSTLWCEVPRLDRSSTYEYSIWY